MNIKLKNLFLYLLLVSAVAMGVSFSRFSTTLTNSGAENLPGIEFSTWVLDHGIETETLLLTGIVPGEEKAIKIRVSSWKNNGEGIAISGYDQSCSLELKTTGNLPLKFTLTESPQGVAGSSQEEIDLYPASSSSYLSEGWEFEAGVKAKKELTLTVRWPGEYNDEYYKNEIDYLQIGLRAVQLYQDPRDTGEPEPGD